MKFETSYTLTENEYVHFMHELSKNVYVSSHSQSRGMKSRLLNYVSAFLAVLLVLYTIESQHRIYAGIALMLFTGLLIGISLMFWQQKNLMNAGILRILREAPGLLNTVASIDDTTISWSSGGIKTELALTSINDLVETKAGFLVRAGILGAFFPNRCFRDDAERKAAIDFLKAKANVR